MPLAEAQLSSHSDPVFTFLIFCSWWIVCIDFDCFEDCRKMLFILITELFGTSLSLIQAGVSLALP